MNRKKTGALLISAGLLSAFLLSGCTTLPKSESLTMTGTYFDTVVQIEVWGADQDMIEHCRKMCETYEQMLSATIDTSEISKINNAGGEPVSVSDETAELIEKGIEYGELSGGRFDITIAPASELWDFTDNQDKTIPDPDELAEAVSHIDYRCVHVDGNTVVLTDPEAQIEVRASNTRLSTWAEICSPSADAMTEPTSASACRSRSLRQEPLWQRYP